MTEEKKPTDRNDPRAHYMLRDWLDTPDTYAHLNPVGLKNLRTSLDLVMAMPSGDGRIALLASLNMALGDMRQRHRLYEENKVLREQLKAERPDVAELTEVARLIKTYSQMLMDKFKEAYAIEAKRGTDMWKTVWPWYEHELYVYMPALVRNAEALARITRERVAELERPSLPATVLEKPRVADEVPVHVVTELQSRETLRADVEATALRGGMAEEPGPGVP